MAPSPPEATPLELPEWCDPAPTEEFLIRKFYTRMKSNKIRKQVGRNLKLRREVQKLCNKLLIDFH